MKTRQENFMRMARAVADTTRRYQETWAGLPRFSAYAAQLFDTLTQIDSEQVQTEIRSTGATLDKSFACEHALHLGDKLSRRATAYAEDHHLYELRNQLKIKRHELLNGHGAEVMHRLRDVQSQLEGILLQLPDYGVTAQHLQEFTAAVDDYEKLLEHPRQTIITRKSHNQTVGDYVAALRRLLLKMDNMVNNFEGTPFEREYHNARIVVDLGTRHEKPAVPKNNDDNKKVVQ